MHVCLERSQLCACVAVRLSHRFGIVYKKACRKVPNCLILAHYTAVLLRFPEGNCAVE